MGALLAQAVTFPELSGPLLVATVAATALWFLLLLGFAFATRPRNVDLGPATMELGKEPPAVVDLLTNEWRVTPTRSPPRCSTWPPATTSTWTSTGPSGPSAGCAAPTPAACSRTSGWSSSTSPAWRWRGSSSPTRSPPGPGPVEQVVGEVPAPRGRRRATAWQPRSRRGRWSPLFREGAVIKASIGFMLRS